MKNTPLRLFDQRPRGHYLPKGKWSLFGKLLLLSLVLQLGITSFESIFPLWIKDTGQFSIAFIGVGLLVCGLVMVVLQPMVAKWGRLFIANPEKQMAIGFLIAGLTLPVFVLVQSQWVIGYYRYFWPGLFADCPKPAGPGFS